jgi:hypothetical protein
MTETSSKNIFKVRDRSRQGDSDIEDVALFRTRDPSHVSRFSVS